ncbi:MAG: CoA activase, partial [Clostridiaceae bacterium]|nr:CoA activase [Clostridiaceae bacterium]
MKTAGICVGASTVTVAEISLKDGNIEIERTCSIPHEGNPRKILSELFAGGFSTTPDKAVVTGRKLRRLVNATGIPEPEALEAAYRWWSQVSGKKAGTLVSAGGETLMVYRLDGEGRIIEVRSGNKCASGTGEFFLQQLKRMDLSIEEAMSIADASNPYKVAGRCSVFCKSDCTHALNKGAPKSRVVSGLCKMMAGKITELLKGDDPGTVLLVGGSASNHIMVRFLEEEGINVAIPEHSRCFEALGAAIWALSHETKPIPRSDELFVEGEHAFSKHPPLRDAFSRVRFMEPIRDQARAGDDCVLGLDVGSTTTKAVLVRRKDRAILAGIYLRTNGDPVGASRKCYAGISSQVDVPINITGLGVTGSGRQIAGLHALTPAVINEIIAHARAAAYFDPEVDTIFEIGGQDAKYTYLTNGVASDYAMNEACSAGTGSFLEESALESLNLKVEEIGDLAMLGDAPPNFSDQCAAFIGSDIKTAIQSGISKADIAAGLVYSICMNYLNRVKGNRPVGAKVFMQGGVCYNKAVPVAMASLTGREIVVPPEPGLMGAYGVAMETMSQQELGQVPIQSFDLKVLADREVVYEEPFVCAGGKEKCDRKCTINRIRLDGKVYPFGGVCNKYYNIINRHDDVDVASLDLVALREKLLCETAGRFVPENVRPNGKRIGINLSLMTNTLLPLYEGFFRTLGYEVVLPDGIDPEGCLMEGAAFCWPMEQAHGTLKTLLDKKPDAVFLPHIKAFPVPGGDEVRVSCPFVQSEPYTLKAAFPQLAELEVLSPVLDMTKSYEAAEGDFMEIGRRLGHGARETRLAFKVGLRAQHAFHEACREAGKRALKEAEASPEGFSIVLFGRPYNAFSSMGNMGIPKKFASRGYRVIPQDFLPVDPEDSLDNMYWASGQWILKAARFVKRHDRLFAAYITNFSCGPDSFLISYFRDIMGQKPSLTLELDSHTADAGVDTRIEAFIDVVKRYDDMVRRDMQTAAGEEPFRTARLETVAGKMMVVLPDGSEYPLTHPRVKVLMPSMGEIGARMLAATMEYVGVKTVSLPPAGEKELALGRTVASCKECLPLLLTAGSLIRYIEEKWNGEDILVNFMPETSGPCRFGQYNIMMREIVRKKKLDRVTMLSLTSENSYAGFGIKFALRAWHTIVLSDVLDDIYSAILAIASDPDHATRVFREISEILIDSIARDPWKVLKSKIQQASRILSELPRRCSLSDIPSIALIGEIYVRRDGFSRQYLVERISKQGIWVRTAPVAEWIKYCDYIVQHRLVAKSRWGDRLKNKITCMVKNPFEDEIRNIFANCGFYRVFDNDVDHLVEAARDLISPRLTGEAILTVGAALAEIVESVDGVLALGPFGCMPSRIAEALITNRLNTHKPKIARDAELVARVMKVWPSLPFLSVETDGNTFPQLIESRLEAFLLQVSRLFQTKGTVLLASHGDGSPG